MDQVPLSSLLSSAATQYGLDPNLLLRQARQESGLNQGAVSPAGAIGVMQIMPATAKGLGVDPNDVGQNIQGGAHYLRQMLDRYNGDYNLALAAYNAGPGRVDAYLKNGAALPSETQKYVAAIMGGNMPAVGGAVPLSSLPTAAPGGGDGINPMAARLALTDIGRRLQQAQQAFQT